MSEAQSSGYLGTYRLLLLLALTANNLVLSSGKVVDMKVGVDGDGQENNGISV